MARRRRVFLQGLTLHVTQRGNNRCATFRTDADYELFLWFLLFAMRRYKFHVHAYALMSNHFHLMVTPESPTALSRGMQSLGRRYVRYFNDRYTRTGTLWEGRFRTAIITDERYWLTCMRYVEMNPVRAGLAGSAESYRWCSYRAHALGVKDPIVVPHAVYDALANTPDRRQEAWRHMCGSSAACDQLETLRKSIAKGVVSFD
jgi:putative transposase